MNQIFPEPGVFIYSSSQSHATLLKQINIKISQKKERKNNEH